MDPLRNPLQGPVLGSPIFGKSQIHKARCQVARQVSNDEPRVEEEEGYLELKFNPNLDPQIM